MRMGECDGVWEDDHPLSTARFMKVKGIMKVFMDLQNEGLCFSEQNKLSGRQVSESRGIG